MQERLTAEVTGRVQMVMFRDFVQRHASALHLSGEVWNEADGSVALIAEGERSQLEILLEQIHRGPVLARVESVTHTFETATDEFAEFRIRYR